MTSSALTRKEHEELLWLSPAAHDEFGQELETAVASLRRRLTDVDPFFVMSVVQDVNLFVPWGEYYEPTHEGLETRVELVAGMLATQAVVGKPDRPTAHEMQAILDEVDRIHLVNFLFNLTMTPLGDAATGSLRFGNALRWMSIRGSSFAGHGEDLARVLYRSQEAWMAESMGFTIDDVIKVGEAVSALHAKRRNALGAAGAEAANAKLMGVASLPDSRRRAAMGRAVKAVIEVTEAGLRDAATVTTEGICEEDPTLEEVRVHTILRDLSVSIGSLDAAAYRGPFDKNPLRERPFLEYADEYLLALPGALTRDVDTLLETRVLTARKAFARQRAKTLDRLAVAYLGEMLPGARTYTNLYYEGAELDGLVMFDRTALVVEGKATGISAQGQRGDLERLRRDVERAVEEAWRQGARARDFLLRPGDSVFSDRRGVEIVRIPSSQVREVVIVNPTLHELAGIAQQLPRLKALGLFESGEYPWSVFINDLRAISETCENAAVFLHYLVWRNRLPLGDRLSVSDEIDLWGSYLFGERFAGLAGDGEMIIANASTDFDAYFDGLAGRGPRRKRPTKFLPDSVKDFVEEIAVSRPPGWREAAGVCLDLSIPELAFVDGTMAEVTSGAAASGVVALVAGRVLLAGIDSRTNASMMLPLIDAEGEDPTFAVACRLGPEGRPEIAWAQYRKPVTFELSDFEEQLLAASAPKDGSR